ncbi:Protein-glutamate O-methyltransferase-like protein 1 [Elsinoe fawcettii]|nr:Protein-glutamate O-methyltransferase-like protein 1 [Elsinoe fawcettii]
MPHSSSVLDRALDGGVRGVWTSDEGTMAAETARTRWPGIVKKMIKDVETADFGLDSSDIISKLQTFNPLIADDRPDYELFNAQLSLTENAYTWQRCPWLFAECYMYRRVHSILSTNPGWFGFDVFKAQKDHALQSSSQAVDELASRFMQTIVTPTRNSGPASIKTQLIFQEMTQIALWGNAADLSLLSTIGLDCMSEMQGQAAITRLKQNIVDDDTLQVWNYLLSPYSPGRKRRIDIILDNAGFELLTDLIYASYLLQSDLADHVVLHVKEIPWFVSDALIGDIDTLLAFLKNHANSDPTHPAFQLAIVLSEHFSTGSITMRSHSFWTTGYSFHEMSDCAPQLLVSLRPSRLVIFKGDLNYRKLTADGLWPHDSPFKQALGPLGLSGLKILSLRTNKADTCVGVDTERLVWLEANCPGKSWVRNGQYAVISFSDGL